MKTLIIVLALMLLAAAAGLSFVVRDAGAQATGARPGSSCDAPKPESLTPDGPIGECGSTRGSAASAPAGVGSADGAQDTGLALRLLAGGVLATAMGLTTRRRV